MGLFLGGMATAVLVGLLRGGRCRGLLTLPLRFESLVFVGLGLRGSLLWAGVYGVDLPSVAVWCAQALSFALLLLVAWLNRTLPGMPTLGFGVLLNGIAILANGGSMPVSEAAAVASGQAEAYAALAAGRSYLHQPLTEATRLPFLTDHLTLPGWFPYNTAFSVGDALIMVGLFVLVQHAMCAPVREERAYPGAA